MKSYTQEERVIESQRIKEKYPDRIPVIVEKDKRSTMPEIDKKKYLVPMDLTVGQFLYVIRKRLKVSPEKAIYLFTENGHIPPTAALMSSVHRNNKANDDFLYFKYSSDNVFG